MRRVGQVGLVGTGSDKPQPRSLSHPSHLSIRSDSAEQALEAREDGVPAVVLVDVTAAGLAEPVAQARVARHQAEHLHELFAVLVVQAAVGAAAVRHRRGVARAGEDRRADGHALEHRLRHQIVGRRRDRDVGGFEGDHPLTLGQHAGLAQVGLVGHAHHLHAHQHERHVAFGGRVAVEVLEHLLAAVVGLDPAAVEREGAVESMTPAERHAAAGEVRLLRRRLGLARHGVLDRDRRRRDPAGDAGRPAAVRARRRYRPVPRVAAARARRCGAGGAPTVESSPSARGMSSSSAHRSNRSDGLQLEVRKEHAAIGRDRQPEDRGGRVESEEHQRVVAAVLALEVIDQRPATHGPAPAYPVELLRARVRFGQEPRGEA